MIIFFQIGRHKCCWTVSVFGKNPGPGFWRSCHCASQSCYKIVASHKRQCLSIQCLLRFPKIFVFNTNIWSNYNKLFGRRIRSTLAKGYGWETSSRSIYTTTIKHWTFLRLLLFDFVWVFNCILCVHLRTGCLFISKG